VKILFDTNTPVPLARWLRGHEVVRTGNLGWQSLENGVLLSAAEDSGFDVLVTCDQNVPLQQNLIDRKIALVVLSTNHWPTMRPLAARIATKIDFAQRGQVLRIDVAALQF
jgi:hypothetical protein